MTDQVKQLLDYLEHLRSLSINDAQDTDLLTEEITQVELDLMHLGYYQ